MLRVQRRPHMVQEQREGQRVPHTAGMKEVVCDVSNSYV